MFHLIRNDSIDLDFKSIDWFLLELYIQNQLSAAVFQNLAIFMRKHLCWSLF